VIPQCERTPTSRTVRLSVESVWTFCAVRHHRPDTLAPLARVSGLSDLARHASSRTHAHSHTCVHTRDRHGRHTALSTPNPHTGQKQMGRDPDSQHAPRATQRNAMDKRNAHSPDRQRYRVVPFHAGCQPTQTARAHHCPPALSPSLSSLALSPSPSLSLAISHSRSLSSCSRCRASSLIMSISSRHLRRPSISPSIGGSLSVPRPTCSGIS
jgi:hypothetical protein